MDEMAPPRRTVDVTKYVGIAAVLGVVGLSAYLTVWGLNSPLGKALSKYLGWAKSAIGGLLDNPSSAISSLVTSLVVLGVGGAALYAVANTLKSRDVTRRGMDKRNEADAKAGRPLTYDEAAYRALDTNAPEGANYVSQVQTAAAAASLHGQLSAEQRATLAQLEQRVKVAESKLTAEVQAEIFNEEAEDAAMRELETARSDLFKTQKAFVGE